MDGRATWLVVAAVVALGAAAVADALREAAAPPRAGPEPRVPPNEAVSPAEPEQLDADVSGVLFYTDGLCRLRAIRLPSLEAAPAPEWDECRVSLSPDRAGALPAGVVWRPPRGDLRALETGGNVYLVADALGWEGRLAGRAPAFKPSGIFTFAQGSTVFELTRDCPLGAERIALYGKTVDSCPRTVARLPGRVLRLGWLTENRLAAVVEGATGGDTFLIWAGGRTELRVPGWGGQIARLRVSPGGTFVAISSETRGLLVFRRDGVAVPLPLLTGAREIAWSPDDRWTVVATRSSVYLFRSEGERARLRRLPIVARDLAWRA